MNDEPVTMYPTREMAIERGGVCPVCEKRAIDEAYPIPGTTRYMCARCGELFADAAPDVLEGLRYSIAPVPF